MVLKEQIEGVGEMADGESQREIGGGRQMIVDNETYL